jgi:hypothetical protein
MTDAKDLPNIIIMSTVVNDPNIGRIIARDHFGPEGKDGVTFPLPTGRGIAFAKPTDEIWQESPDGTPAQVYRFLNSDGTEVTTGPFPGE